ncbi:flagellar biosynthesis protein FliQ [Methylogaea oryzae]|uniref:Flagellar biosynthetic protein FliQ n=1 Tax=Methylogaea oryzae TaxID=1295382 RepID=A0A8D5AHI3_9GAMM|nr:flagellar biosynthesis protein FliQ [Methylogaea oryzae]BBL71503.1 flagellar export apparatus protein FliQ [Methylogaea oryzae]
MTPDTVTELGRQALWVALIVTTPILLTALVVGLIIAIFQAATSINEQTLTFVPKLLVIGAVMVLAGPWLITTLMDYTRDLIRSIPSLIG